MIQQYGGAYAFGTPAVSYASDELKLRDAPGMFHALRFSDTEVPAIHRIGIFR
jgi:hypothetical protein